MELYNLQLASAKPNKEEIVSITAAITAITTPLHQIPKTERETVETGPINIAGCMVPGNEPMTPMTYEDHFLVKEVNSAQRSSPFCHRRSSLFRR